MVTTKYIVSEACRMGYRIPDTRRARRRTKRRRGRERRRNMRRSMQNWI